MKYALLLLALLALGHAPGLDTKIARGRKTVLHAVPNGGPAEICVEPRHVEHVAYRSDDEQTEDLLCSYDFYKPGITSETGAVATCPHATSTTGSIEFQEISKQFSRDQLQTAKACGLHRPTSKLTRFKPTEGDVTNTFAPGAMLSYHVSRMLGGILFVPVTVLRTVDTAVVRDVAMRAPAVVTNDLVKKSFAYYLTALSDPPAWRRWDMFTSDYRQLWGFLSAKVKDDSIYPGWVEEITADRFESEQGVRDAFSEPPAQKIFGSALNQESLQRMMLARDFADLIVFDEIMSQGDRFTGQNLAYLWVYYSPSPGRLQSIERRRVDKGKAKLPAGAMLIRRLVSTDNDCVIRCNNVSAAHGYVSRLRHLNPRTYEGVMQLAEVWSQDKTLKQQLALDLNLPGEAMTAFG